MKKTNLIALVAMGLAGTTATAQTCTPVVCGPAANKITAGRPYVINITGATLLENVVSRRALYNDFIDVDGDGISGSCNANNESLSPAGSTPNPTAQHWHVMYRVIGSVNGFSELLTYGQTFVQDGSDSSVATDADFGPNPGVIRWARTDTAYHNGTQYLRIQPSGAPLTDKLINDFNRANPGAAPVRFDNRLFLNEANTVPNPEYLKAIRTPNPIRSTFIYDPTPAGGATIEVGAWRPDIAPLDVSSQWAVRNETGSTSWDRLPLTGGYGNNPVTATTRTGAPGPQTNKLPSLGAYNFNFSSPDSNTIYDTDLAWAPIATVTNHGTGYRQIKITEIQHLFVTGRMPSGENIIAITRDVGSGTRNAYNNSTGVDPSQGVGDNVGPRSTSGSENTPGAQYIPTNKGSNGGQELTIFNTRLGIGYIGAERGVNGGWILPVTTPGFSFGWNRAEVLAVAPDTYAGWDGVSYYRPTIANVLKNNSAGYPIGGAAVLSSIGDPRNANEVGGVAGNSNPRMRNPQAAALLNNIRTSICNFNAVPSDVDNIGSPGELLATVLILPPALENLQSFSSPQVRTANPIFNAGLNADALARSVLANPAYNAFNTASPGRVPIRLRVTGNPNPYGDGVNEGFGWRTFSSGTLAWVDNNSVYDARMIRNKISGDFSGNGVRDAADIPQLVAATRWVNGTNPGWTPLPGTGAIAGAPAGDIVPELIGDFNCDGDLTAADVRYFADGLALYSGVLNRKQGFIDVDAAFANFFGYPATFSTGKAYENGDARGDVFGSGNISKGWAPTGANGSINSADITYVAQQYRQNPFVQDFEATWSDLNEAQGFDLSADMTGDNLVNFEDTNELVRCILGTTNWDFDLDGVDYFAGDIDDINTFNANNGTPGVKTFAQGDANGDGTVDALDLCRGDINLDGSTDLGDFFTFFGYYDSGSCLGDINGGGNDLADFFDFFAAFDAGC